MDLNESQFFEIDGSFGEGGGQILRTALTLSSILKKPVKIKNIRAKRNNPGLRSQHVATVRILADMCGAKVENLNIGASWITFKPEERSESSLRFDIGTAGSITLILTAIIPVASLNGVGCNLEIKGGTDVKWSPTIDYFKYVVLDAFRYLGIYCTIDVVKRGFYPRGGGIVKMNVNPSKKLMPMQLVSRRTSSISGISICSNLLRNVAERQMKTALHYLAEKNLILNDIVIDSTETFSPGSSITLYSVCEKGSFLGADMIGEIGKSAEKVGQQVAQLFLKEYFSEAPIDMHLGDILVTPLFLAAGESKFKVSAITPHIQTNLYVASLMTGRKHSLESHNDGTNTITIESN